MSRRRAVPATPALVVLLMALVEFGQVWFYPGGDPSLDGSRPFGGAYRMALWLGAGLVVALHLAREGPAPFVRTLWPFGAFVVWGAVSVPLWSVDPVTGARTLAFWSIAAGLAVVAGDGVPPARLARGAACLFGAVVAGSLALALLFPGAAHTVYGDELVVRGLFPHKNQFGWFAAIGLLWTCVLREEIGPVAVRLLVPLLGAGIIVAGSGTALVVLVAASGYLVALGAAQRFLPDGGRAALALATASLVAGLVSVALAPVLLDALGRDPTLTGRTDVWRHYLDTIELRALSGYGTGVFSSPSALNVAVGATVPGQETAGLHSPHSLYITLLGETGVLGLATFLLAVLHLAFVAPFRAQSPWLALSGALAFAILVAGLAETRDGYAPGVATVALLAARAAAFAQGRAALRSPTPSRAYS